MKQILWNLTGFFLSVNSMENHKRDKVTWVHFFMSVNLNFNIDINPVEIAKSIGKSLERLSVNDNGLIDGGKGRFISMQGDGVLCAAFYHSTKPHTATCEVHNNFTKNFGVGDHVVRSAKSSAGPGKWAVAYTKSGQFGGDRTFYNIL